MRRLVVGGLVVTGLLTTLGAGIAQAGSNPPLPSVSVRPYALDPTGPNRGQWFVFLLRPGQSATEKALIVNTSRVRETVTVYARDLLFSDNGSPQVSDGAQTDVGAWTSVSTPWVSIGPRGRAVVGFVVRVPRGALPGDHIGVLVVQSAPQADGRDLLIERVATRLYVTVPGHALPGMALGPPRRQIRNPLWPSSALVGVVLRNTGQIRLAPRVSVGGRPATGSSLLLARSAELYTAVVHLNWWGGPAAIVVRAAAPGLRPQTRVIHFWVVNWVLIAVVLQCLLMLSLAITEWRWAWREPGPAELFVPAQRAEALAPVPSRR